MGDDLFSSRSLPDPLVGRTLDGRYKVLDRLGVGGVGVVYRGKQVKLGRLVAIKVLQQHAADMPEWRRRFDREAKALSELAHPNVVPVNDSGIDDGVPYLVMELLRGRTLADLVKEGPLRPARALDIVRQMLRGLAFAHTKGIVHRDLKPANVFLQALPDKSDHVRLLDFGMAKFLESSAARSMVESLTKVGAVFGTPAYMSPEQAKAEPVDASSDVYAAGVVLFQLLAGHLPYAGDSYEQVMKAHVFDPIPSLVQARPDLAIAPLLEPILARALAKKKTARFSDAAAMLAALEAPALSRAAAARPRRFRRGKPRELAYAPTERAATAPRQLRPFSRFWRAAVVLIMLGAATTGAIAFLRGGASSRTKSTVSATATTPPTPAPPTPAKTTAKSPAPPREAKPLSAAPAPTPAPTPTSAPAPAPARTSAEKSRPRARNPWREPVPRALKPIRDGIERGARMSQRSLRPAYEFARDNPRDPRPWLLLGRAYAQLDWLSDATDRYVHAYHVDASCRGDPQMLADLLKATEHRVAGRSAARAIHDIYGAEAIPALEKAMKRRAPDHDATTRLARLHDSLSQ
jgi:serine/threonine-protein kinase